MELRVTTLLILVGGCIAQNDLIVTTSYGSIQGYESASVDGTRVRTFKAVPFAAPPVGNLRWKLPEWPKKWEGIKDGRKYSAACMSNSTTSSSPQPWVDEDCLYLNIFIHGECTEEKKCPILVYLHGGNLNYDSATYFNDTALIDNFASKGVMFVIPAFRLGFTEQFSLGDNQQLIPSNLGLHDALQGIKFLHKEGTAFGGDPDAITVMGHSFGGTMAIMLAFSPYRKLQVPIHQYIIMSSGIYFDTPEKQANLSKEMIKRAGCNSISKKVTHICMMEKSGQELLAIQREIEEETSITFGGLLMSPPFFPMNSIPELLQHPPNANLIIGATNSEYDLLRNPLSLPGASIGSYIGARNVVELDELYFNLTESGKNNQTHEPGTQASYTAVYLTAKAVLGNGNKAFVYMFDQPTHNAHAKDLTYFMGIHPFEKDEHEEVIAKIYPELFLNFTKYGEPSPEWKPFDSKESYFSIAVNVTTGRMPELREGYEKETIDFWVKKAPIVDRMITVSKAAGARMQWDKINGEYRDLIFDNEPTSTRNESLIPVVLVYTSYFPTFLLICSVFLLGVLLGQCLFAASSSRDERMWILGSDGSGMRGDPGKPPAYAEQVF